MTFGERLIELRRQKGFKNRVEFANFLHIPSTTLRNYETDTREPNFDFLTSISKQFGVSLDYLLCLTDDPTPVTDRPELTKEETLLLQKYRDLDDLGKFAVDTIINVGYKYSQKLKQVYERLPNNNSSKAAPMRSIPYYQRLASAGTGQWLFDDIPVDTIEIPDVPGGEIADFAIGINGNSMRPLYRDGDILLIHKQDAIDIGDIGLFIVNGESYIKKLGDGRLISLNKNFSDILLNETARCVGQALCTVGDIICSEEDESYANKDSGFMWAAENGNRSEDAQKMAKHLEGFAHQLLLNRNRHNEQ